MSESSEISLKFDHVQNIIWNFLNIPVKISTKNPHVEKLCFKLCFTWRSALSGHLSMHESVVSAKEKIGSRHLSKTGRPSYVTPYSTRKKRRGNVSRRRRIPSGRIDHGHGKCSYQFEPESPEGWRPPSDYSKKIMMFASWSSALLTSRSG